MKTTIVFKIKRILIFFIIIMLFLLCLMLKDMQKNVFENSNEKLNIRETNEIEEDSYINKTIFFVASERPNDKKLILNARSACSIESAAVHNKNWNIVLVAVDVIDLSEESINVQTLRTYSNFHIMNTTVYELAKGTPIEEWVASDAWKNTQALVEHLSDLLRLMLLWKYGGVYLDEDVISFVNYDILKPNWVGAELPDRITSAAISFAPNGFGHYLAGICLIQFTKHFNGNIYVANGPDLITRVLKFICSTEKITDMNRKTCNNYEVFSPKSFYTVYGNVQHELFSEQLQDHVVDLYTDSYGIHFWNVGTKTMSGKKGTGALNIFASRHCPKMYAVTENIF